MKRISLGLLGVFILLGASACKVDKKPEAAKAAPSNPTESGTKAKLENEARTNAAKLNQRLTSDPYGNSTSVKKLSGEDGSSSYIPKAKGQLAKITGKHLLIQSPQSISRVVISSSSEDGNFRLGRGKIELPATAADRSNGDKIKAVFVKAGLENLISKRHVTLPILISSGGYGYRAERYCLADVNGKCEANFYGEEKYLPLEDSFGEAKAAGRNYVPLFPTLRLTNDPPKTIAVEYISLGDSRFNESDSKSFSTVAHPGENPYLEEITDLALKQFMSELPGKSMFDFVTTFGLGDCDMIALAAIQRFKADRQANPAFGKKEILEMVSGYRLAAPVDSTPQVIDMLTSNHAWNLYTAETDNGGGYKSFQFSWYDYTPATASSDVRFAMTEPLVNEMKRGIIRMHRLEDFSSWNLLENVKMKETSPVYDAETFKAATEKAYLTLVEQTFSPAEWVTLPHENGYATPVTTVRSNKTGIRVNVFVDAQYFHPAPVGALLFVAPPPSTESAKKSFWKEESTIVETDYYSRVSLRSPKSPAFLGIGMSTEAKVRNFSAELLAAEEDKTVNFEWPKLSTAQITKYYPEFMAHFNAKPNSMGSHYENYTMSQGHLQKSHYGNNYPGDKAPTSQQVADFWRSRGFQVDPIFNVRLKVAVTMPE